MMIFPNGENLDFFFNRSSEHELILSTPRFKFLLVISVVNGVNSLPPSPTAPAWEGSVSARGGDAVRTMPQRRAESKTERRVESVQISVFCPISPSIAVRHSTLLAVK